MIFKPSNHRPSLSEIDTTENNTFSCTVNTSGESVKAYKMSILSEDGSDVIVDTETKNLLVPMPNKSQVNLKNICVSYEDENHEYPYADLVNGKNYQWGIRLYNALKGSTAQPNTKVCDGYLVGSTKYVTWMKLEDQTTTNKDVADQIVYDRYIEYYITNQDRLLVGAHEPEEKRVPDVVSSAQPFIQRKKIEWVTKELGINKDFIKIETSENFDYDFISGTEFDIYKCSSDHTVTSAFADPNTNINVADKIMIYENATAALNAFINGEDPSYDNPDSGSSSTAIFKARKIVGYSSDTGEIRVDDPWSMAPSNGQVYRIFSQDVSTKLYTEVLTSDLKFKVPTGTTVYSSIVPANTTCYIAMDTSSQASSLPTDYTCTVINSSWSRINKAGKFYYVQNSNLGTPASINTSQEYWATYIDHNCCQFSIDGAIWNVPFENTLKYVNQEQISNFYDYQVIGGRPVLPGNENFKNVNNNWLVSGTFRDYNSGTPVPFNNVFYLNGDTSQVAANEEAIIYKDTTNNLLYRYHPSDTSGDYVGAFYQIEEDASTVDIENRVFIQPNINIKNDFYNPDEIVFTNGSRIDIIEQYYYMINGRIIDINEGEDPPAGAKKIDCTLNKLDNSQWLLENCPLNKSGLTISSIGVPQIIPQSDYGIYTDFADSAPYNIIYARREPKITIQYRNAGEELVQGYVTESDREQTYVDTFYDIYGDEIENPSTIYIYHDANTDKYYRYYTRILPDYPNGIYKNIDDVWETIDYYNPDDPRDFGAPHAYRMAEFRALWEPEETGDLITQIKSYQYSIYGYYEDSMTPELIKKSDIIYSTDTTWIFRGLDGVASEYYSREYPHRYTIAIQIIDEYDKEYNVSANFAIFYETDNNQVSMIVKPDCDTQSIYVEVNSPVFADYIDDEDWGLLKVSAEEDWNSTVGEVVIPEGRVLDYAQVLNDNEDLIFPDEFSFYTEFQLTKEFINSIPEITEDNLDPSIPIFEICHNTGDETYSLETGVPYYLKTLPQGTRYYSNSSLEDEAFVGITEDNTTECYFVNTTYSYIVLEDGSQKHTYYVATQLAGTTSGTVTGNITIKNNNYAEAIINDITYYVETRNVTITPVLEKFTGMLHSFQPYYSDSDEVTIINNNAYHLTIHKDGGSALECFTIANMPSTWVNILEPGALVPTYYINYSLQEEISSLGHVNYVIVNTLPQAFNAQVGTYYVLRQSYSAYAQGIYEVIVETDTPAYWHKVTNRHYMFLDSTDNVANSTYNSLSVPTNDRIDDAESGTIGVDPEGNLWIEDTSESAWTEAIENNKFCFYLKVYKNGNNQVVSAEVTLQRIERG